MSYYRSRYVASLILCLAASLAISPLAGAQPAGVQEKAVGAFHDYRYETKPDDPAFAIFNPRKAPAPGPLMLVEGDRLAICGDSITEQRRYSRIIETYLTACTPQLEVTVRQYGWSGEKADGFFRRMEQDCLTFHPTVATLCYGMNDALYRPFDVTNGQRYEDYYRAIVRRFKADGVRVVVGTPGCAGKLAAWVKDRVGTLDEQNVALCAFRDIAIGVAEAEECPLADVFWPMIQAQVFAPGQHGATADNPYRVAGVDGIHPGWSGHVVMAYAFLKAMGLDGQIGQLRIDLAANSATASDGHDIEALGPGEFRITSTRYPFCATGDIDDDDTVRSGMTLVPFDEDLNRLMLIATGGDAERYEVAWGDATREFTAEELAHGVNLAAEFIENPFCDAFQRVDQAVKKKQAFETEQVKRVFHGPRGKEDFPRAVRETEAERAPLAAAIQEAVVPVVHTIHIRPVGE